MKLVEAADAVQPAVPPRASVTVVAPSEPVIVVLPLGPLVSAAVVWLETLNAPPVRLNVVAVAAAAAAGMAMATASPPVIAATSKLRVTVLILRDT